MTKRVIVNHKIPGPNLFTVPARWDESSSLIGSCFMRLWNWKIDLEDYDGNQQEKHLLKVVKTKLNWLKGIKAYCLSSVHTA